MLARLPFAEVWAVDYEFSTDQTFRPVPICLVAKELRSGRIVRQWFTEFGPTPPYPLGRDALFVAFNAAAEFSCHLAWPLPARTLDLFTEDLIATNLVYDTKKVKGINNNLLGALARRGLPHIEVAEKASMQSLAIRGAPFTDEERTTLMDYCEGDVVALERLLLAILPTIDLYPAVFRGRYMGAVARMIHNGVPIDMELWGRLKADWDPIQDDLIRDVDRQYGVFLEGGRAPNQKLLQRLAAEHQIPWPRTQKGRLSTKSDTLRSLAKEFPILNDLKELMSTLSTFRLGPQMRIGSDGRNRYDLWPFSSATGRNQPSPKNAIFGTAVWLRGLIRPQPSMAIAYLDWKSQEIAIVAALSGDERMMKAYSEGDFYVNFAKLAGLLPQNATKESHPEVRDRMKACALGANYGREPISLAAGMGMSVYEATQLLRQYFRQFSTYALWRQRAASQMQITRTSHTMLGWRVKVLGKVNRRSAMNFPVQGGGADMMRLAACIATERGIRVCAPIHDAFLIEAPIDEIDLRAAEMQEIMRQAAKTVLKGFPVPTDVSIVRYPDRYSDKRGVSMWKKVMALLDACESAEVAAA